MDCPHCHVPLMKNMVECPKCKYDTRTSDGGPKHKAWLQDNADPVAKAQKEKQLEEQAELQRRRLADPLYDQKQAMLMTTCPSLEGYRITEQYGLVFGEVAFKTGFFKSLGASFDNFMDIVSAGDKELSGTARLLDSSREFAVDKLKTAAIKKGANAIIGIDSESSIGGDIMHVTIYGTAVKVEKL